MSVTDFKTIYQAEGDWITDKFDLVVPLEGKSGKVFRIDPVGI